MSESSNILASFCVKCYNQRDYIGEALDGAFTQTYRPLEIVISDDCSTDGSAEIIKAKIAEYKTNGGDVPIIFNRNERNLGNVGNWIVFGDLAHGELLIKADGDDISLPDRTSKIVAAWIVNDKMAKVIDHAASNMDFHGVDIGGRRRVLGAAQAYSRECWEKFPVKGVLPPRKWVGDDTIFSIRAYAIAGAERYQLLMDDVLVRYRCGSGATTSHKKFRKKLDSYTVECIKYAVQDIENNMNSLDAQKASAARLWCLHRIREEELNRRLSLGSSISERMRAASALRREFGRDSLKDVVYQIMLSIPPALSDPFLDLYLNCKEGFRK